MFANSLAVAGLLWLAADIVLTVAANKYTRTQAFTLNPLSMLSAVVGVLWLVFG